MTWTRSRKTFLEAVVALCLASLAGCSSCREAFVAELIAKDSNVDRDFGKAPNVWSPAKQGDRFELGDGVRTGPDAQATLALPRRARLQVKSDTIIHFKKSLDPAAPAEQVEVSAGELTIDTGALDLSVNTGRGVVKLSPETTVRMKAEPTKTHFDVVVGRVEYDRDGVKQTAQAGANFDVEVGTASVERGGAPFATTAPSNSEPREAPPPRPEETKPTKSEAESGTPLSRLSFQEPPARALVTLAAGETATIHDPAPPSDVRVTFTGCPELGVLELDKGNGRFDMLRGRGTGEVRVSIPRGSFRYRVRCVRGGLVQPGAAARGTLTIKEDAATRPLPQSPVTITADADGRRYIVSYQNRLPVITLRWPDAPPASAYRLFVKPEHGNAIAIDSPKSIVTLEPGRVAEGLHQFWFETKDKKRSEQGLLQVAFDYTARTAYLTSPLEGEPAKNGRAQFSGGTLMGSSVRLQGVPVKLDSQGRFSSNIEIPAAAGGASVRVQHPSAGIHYYVRHLR